MLAPPRVCLIVLMTALPVDASCRSPVDMAECLFCCHEEYPKDKKTCGILKFIWPPAYTECVAVAREQEHDCVTQCGVDFP